MANSKLSILAKVSPSDIVAEPFPHVVVHDALDNDLYEELEKTYPDFTTIVGQQKILNNMRYQIAASQLGKVTLNPLWEEFVRYHVSEKFYREVIALFGSHIRRLYPRMEEKLNKSLEDCGTAIRGDDNTAADIVLDCQPGLNAPVTTPTRSRGPHVDSPYEIYASLLYMRSPQDDSTGGDLELYRYQREGFAFNNAELDDCYTEKIGTVKYSRNTLVFFINSLSSLHGVTVRSRTAHCRRLVNIIGETYRIGRLFKVPQKNPIREKMRWLLNKGMKNLTYPA